MRPVSLQHRSSSWMVDSRRFSGGALPHQRNRPLACLTSYCCLQRNWRPLSKLRQRSFRVRNVKSSCHQGSGELVRVRASESSATPSKCAAVGREDASFFVDGGERATRGRNRVALRCGGKVRLLGDRHVRIVGRRRLSLQSRGEFRSSSVGARRRTLDRQSMARSLHPNKHPSPITGKGAHHVWHP
jgi:hypothetical protein